MLVDRQTQTWTKFKYLIDIVVGRPVLPHPIVVALKGSNEVGKCQKSVRTKCHSTFCVYLRVGLLCV